MDTIDELLELAREVTGLDWQLRLDTAVDPNFSDLFTQVLRPVAHPDKEEDYVLIFVVGGPESGKLEPQIIAEPDQEFFDGMARWEEHQT
jgi:hypothetical protein